MSAFLQASAVGRGAVRSAFSMLFLVACSNGDAADLQVQPGLGDAGLGSQDAASNTPAPLPDSGSATADSGALSDPTPLSPGVPIVPGVTDKDSQTFEALKLRAADATKLDAAGLRAAYPVQFRGPLSYDPSAAGLIELIQGSALALSEGERAVLGQNGFVVSTRREFPTFLRGLAEIYSEHLPLYVTVDALLEAVHSSYDQILLSFEQGSLVPELKTLLGGMRTRLAQISGDDKTLADTDLYLAVALSLLQDTAAAPVRGAAASEVTAIVTAAKAATGTRQLTLFGSERMEDFSQFKPRGHYAGDPALSAYFRAMIWLGRVDLRLIETLSDGRQVFRRDQYLSSLVLHELVAPDAQRYAHIDEVIRTFVGESDYMVVPEVAALIADLGGLDAARKASDQSVIDAIVKGGYGKQQIASHLMVNDGTVKTLPLNRSFALFGQRYVVDSHVFSEVVYDRIQDRMMPSPLDAAFAALGNAQAAKLDPDVDSVPELPGALARMRVLIDAHDESFWNANFYNLWLSSLRALSPAPDLTLGAMTGMPEVMGTEAWGRRLLNAQLGSWAELRHDTLLYAKQSYTGIPGCAFPDAYIDPYPAFFTALVKYAAAGSQLANLAASDAALAASITSYFTSLSRTASVLGEMVTRELRGEPFSTEQLAFINDAVRIEKQSVVCTTIDVPDGWYADLFFERDKSIEFNPTIADVHTQPADEGGNLVGKVLHVGTGYPRLMVTSVDTCNGPRAYVGVVYAYHEEITKNFERLDDQAWAARFATGGTRPADVSWLEGVLAK